MRAMVLLISFAAFASTLLGGLFALRLKDKLHLILGFSAGAVVGVAFFDLMPEALRLGQKWYEGGTVLAIVAIGFLVYLVLDRLVFLHVHAHTEYAVHANDGDPAVAEAARLTRGALGAMSLCIHSALDGAAIGLAYQISATIGAIVAIAVLTHDFSDGVNTVTLILRHDGRRGEAIRWLIADAVAPVLGAASTLMFTVPERSFSIILALFSGFFLYIGASDLIPESQHEHPKIMTTLMTLFGVGVLFAAVHLAE